MLSFCSAFVDQEGRIPEHMGAQVSFQWKNPDFLLKNVAFLLKNVDFIIKQASLRLAMRERLYAINMWLSFAGRVYLLGELGVLKRGERRADIVHVSLVWSTIPVTRADIIHVSLVWSHSHYM